MVSNVIDVFLHARAWPSSAITIEINLVGKTWIFNIMFFICLLYDTIKKYTYSCMKKKKNSYQLLAFRSHACQAKNIFCIVTIRKDLNDFTQRQVKRFENLIYNSVFFRSINSCFTKIKEIYSFLLSENYFVHCLLH